jgi:ATP-binding cassette subfamily B protein
MDPASVFVFMIIMIRLVPIVRTFLNAKQLINRTVGPIEAIDSILDEMSKASLNNNECLPEDSIDNNFLDINKLQLVTVSYRYSAKEPFVLSDISLDLDQSTVNAVVGPSGGGKSTLIDIITGYRSPTTGKILLNGEEANDINNYKISNLLSYVPQDPQLFDGEVGEHIFYGNKTLTYDDMLKASELSGAHNFIKNLQNGYATVLNNNGSNFSGGQRFRIDFARALLSNAPLLVLDEPLSGLDYAGKNLFIKSINKIKKETSKIIIIITHDLSFYELFDKIIVIENGVIDTHTTHKELIESNKWYRNGFNNDL